MRLRQLVSNLLSNAVKFTHQGQVLVEVETATTEDGRQRLTVRVSDTGIGIPPGAAAALFQSFSQVDASTTRVYGGTGLGLAISQRIAEAMAGGVSLTSEVGAGSTFTATVVLDTSSDATAPPHAGERLLALVGTSVLVVDDNNTNLQILKHKLTSLGMVCTVCADPRQALEQVTAGLTYDVAILDQNMPQMTGVDLAAALQQGPHHSEAPHILLTSMGRRPLQEGLFVACLTKPVRTSTLHQALIAALSARSDGVEPSAAHDGLAPIPHQLRILLAEDNPLNQRVLELVLGKLGQHAMTVSNGSAALQAVTDRPFDLVLMDVNMPIMDGLEATRRIRADLHAHQPHIVGVTAGALIEDAHSCLAAGMDAYLAKPVRAAEIQTLITRLSPPQEASGAVPSPAATPDTAQPVPTPSEDEVIDGHAFDRLMTDLDDTDGNLRAELVRTYLLDGVHHLTKLGEAIASGDTATSAICAHTLRSTSALLGALTLAELLQRTEVAAMTSPADLDGLIALVEAEYARVTQRLEQLLAAAPQPLRHD
jgi:CheY-like chemotaxis protein/anti-sigma regulatory factor (Ser/Thr protein kinase)/HPt (histidine-containing phosphotransfer) domain-containing protein